ncbi:IBR domain, a half RING-finger domain-containing protein [Ditylenchus destructor]|uniref:RBR-type E3 ubiquitin transferase n=1 Tax=Ditylenchus destructor TaxID=166010 RepID=A0AAD4R7J1_9BILA|nr:IBR domain, a half RING-finger domain-containing protein [Ditylenchus destructor]
MEYAASFNSDECSDDYQDNSYDYDDYVDESDGVEASNDVSSSSYSSDPEYVEYSCLDVAQVEVFLNKLADELSASTSIVPSLAKFVLHLNAWDVEKVKSRLSTNKEEFLVESGVKAMSPSITSSSSAKIRRFDNKIPSLITNNSKSAYNSSTNNNNECTVCYEAGKECLVSLDCGHVFCEECWELHIDAQLQNGVSTKIECMDTDCHVICPEDFALKMLKYKPRLKHRYLQLTFREHVNSHPHLRWCPGRGCHTIVFCKTNKAHRVACSNCNSKFCMKCGQNYHAPASCDVIKMWLTKCADDSETANYISAHTKDCPNCHSCIEKNGGCNHMQCSKCKYHFCWMCFRDWKSHGSEYYECSRYKENPAVAQEANHLKARRALEKYLHYYERFENHNKSLKMEEDMREKIKAKIEEKISRHEGTWIDWQYLHSAAQLLTKCRYTLQYTYPFAYYMESSARKQLLEKEIEELSWKVERAETTDRGDLENQMHRVEQRRRTLLQDFFD